MFIIYTCITIERIEECLTRNSDQFDVNATIIIDLTVQLDFDYSAGTSVQYALGIPFITVKYFQYFGGKQSVCGGITFNSMEKVHYHGWIPPLLR